MKIELEGEYTLQELSTIIRENASTYFSRGFTADTEEAVKEFCISAYGHSEREHFYCLWLDTKNRLIKQERLFSGSVASACVTPREIVKSALKVNAAAVIFCHNHPSGDTKPSMADKVLTHKLTAALALVDTIVLDHIVVGDGALSMAGEGMLRN